MKRALKIAIATVALAATAALAQGYGSGHGPGMMGGYGPGMMGGAMMDGYSFAGIKLTAEQEDKLFAIQEQNHAKNFATMTKVRAEAYKLRRLSSADSVDAKAVLEQQKKVDELRREMLASRLEMHKQVEAVLTAEQRKQTREYGPWWMHE